MRIGKTDFERGYAGQVHQAVLDVVPEEEAVDEGELRAAYEGTAEEGKPSFEQVVEDLTHLLERKKIGGEVFYIRRQPWLTSDQVARRLGVSKRTVQAWVQQGKLLGQQVGRGVTDRRRVRIAADTVEEWIRGTRNASPRMVGDPTVTEVWDNEKDAGYDRL
jgi:excisionase family DNA binding protein